MAGNLPSTEHESSEQALTLLRNRLSGRNRSRLLVEIDLDPVPGWGNTPEDHQRWLQQYLTGAIGHYNPTVTISSQSGGLSR